MSDSSINIVIGGAAGQGLATIGKLMSKACVRAGYQILVDQRYMSRVRGGHNTFAIRVGSEELYGPTETIDILVALNAETIALHRDKLAESGLVVTGDDIEIHELNALRIPFKELAPKPLFHNTVALGVLGAVVCQDVAIFEKLLGETFSKKGDAVVQANIDVLRASFAWVKSQDSVFNCLDSPTGTPGRNMMINGNEAVALGNSPCPA